MRNFTLQIGPVKRPVRTGLTSGSLLTTNRMILKLRRIFFEEDKSYVVNAQ